MEKGPYSSSSTKKEPKEAKMASTGFSLINEDLLQNILSRLPALSFASAACISKSWSKVCNRILSRPNIASAISLNPCSLIAIQEVLDKVLSKPIRPHFAIVNVGSGFEFRQTLQLITEKLGSETPIVLSSVGGIIGRDALTDEFREVNWGDEAYIPENDSNSGIILTVGFVPGLKVDAIPLLRERKVPRMVSVDRFVMDIRNYTASVSGCTSPAGIIMFGDLGNDQKAIVEKLDYALPMETAIVGDEKGQFLYRSGNDLRNCGSLKHFPDAVALVFARDRDKPSGIGEIQFHVALSSSVSAIGPRHKAVSVRVNNTDLVTWLTARREGQQEILDGLGILNGLHDELESHLEFPGLYIGVTKRRKCSIGSEKARMITSLSFHGVVGGDEEYLYADGVGIKTGDYFQFYRPDPNTAITTCSDVSVKLRNLKLDRSSKNDFHTRGIADNVHRMDVFGGFIFSCCGRGESFFDRRNVDSSPFLENFPGVPLSGVFCGGEIGRGFANLNGQGSEEENSSRCCLHVFSTVFLVMSYTPATPEH